MYTGEKDISEQLMQFYSNLYKKSDIPTQTTKNYLNDINLPYHLDSADIKMCELDITPTEIQKVVNNLKRNKSPGMDGLTYEFYQKFWDKLEPIYMQMIKESFEKKILPDSTKKALLTLLYKQGDKSILANYRPLSITNCDYKILTFVLANRLQNVIKKLISIDQSGYIKSRYIGYSTRLVNDIIEYCESFNQKGAIICLDFQKAFDTLDWEFMFGCLKKFGFGNNFISWISTIYNQPTFCVKNNGWITSELTMQRGVRQGCAISALLFILAVEILSIKIKQAENINGIQIFNDLSYLIQYADDTTLTLADEQSITNAMNLLHEYSKTSGLNLNLNKCSGIWLGSMKNNPDIYSGITFTKQPIKCLGIYIGTDYKACENKNWGKKLMKLRSLSLIGKKETSHYKEKLLLLIVL